MKQVWTLSEEEADRLVKIVHKHVELAKSAAINPHLRDEALEEIDKLMAKRIELIGR